MVKELAKYLLHDLRAPGYKNGFFHTEIIAVQQFNLSSNLKTNTPLDNYSNSLHSYLVLILPCGIGEQFGFLL
jgi:hypothetical protein